MKISGFSDEITPNFEQQLDFASACGLSAIEIRGVNERNISTYSPDEAQVLAKTLSQYGMQVSSIGSPIGKIAITDDFEPHFERFRNLVEVAKVLSCRYIRMFSFYVPSGEAEQWTDTVLERLSRMVDYAKQADVVLLHENEKGIFGDTAPRCRLLMDKLYCDHFQAVFDFANFVQCGENTLEAFRLMRPYIAYVHIKDALFAGGQVVPAGWGEGNVKEILSMLHDSGYDGWLSLEPHLTDFGDFHALEKGVHGEKWQMDGRTAFHIAADALKALLWELNWQ